MWKSSNESFETLRTHPLPGLSGFLFGMKGRTQAGHLRAGPPPQLLVCSAPVPCSSRTLGLLGWCCLPCFGGALRGYSYSLCYKWDNITVSIRFVLLSSLRVTVFSANSFIDQGINEGRELTSGVLSAQRGMLALQPLKRRKHVKSPCSASEEKSLTSVTGKGVGFYTPCLGD